MSRIKWKYCIVNIWRTRKKYNNFQIFTRHVFTGKYASYPSYTLSDIFQAEQSQAQILETALASEKENFHRLKVALDTERIRSREAIDRDNDTILDLRTALEARIFWKLNFGYQNIETKISLGWTREMASIKSAN